jgi:Fur family transcriptional regulator, ferric uptake regulator
MRRCGTRGCAPRVSGSRCWRPCAGGRRRSRPKLYAELRAAREPVGLTTVYRTLTSLADAGFLDTFLREGEQAFRLCSDEHHHHLVCEVCNRVEELESDLVDEWVRGVAGRHGFAVTGHRADIFGICSSCS